MNIPLFFLLLATPALGHAAEFGGQATHLRSAESPYERWSGPYLLEDGRLLVVTDLVDQMPAGAHQLMVVDHASGWVRTLHPRAEEEGEFDIGAGFFRAAPTEGRIRFVTGTEWEQDRILVSDDEDRQVEGRRAPVRREEVEFESDGAPLAGVLLLPPEERDGPYPALVFVHGSGPLTRRSPAQVGYQMAMGGVAALVFDKRGTGRSGGTFQPNAVAQNARDAVAAVDHARAHPLLDPDRIGLHAASEGGFVAPQVFEARPDLAALICRVCSILSWADALPAYTRRSRLEPAGVPPGEIEDALSFIEAQVEYALHGTGYEELVRRHRAGEGSRWGEVLGLNPAGPNPPGAPAWEVFRDFLSADPSSMYRTIQAPVLVVLGAEDPRVPGSLHAPRARELLSAGASSRWEVWELEGANHGLMIVRTDPEGRDLAPTSNATGLHPSLVRWVREALGEARVASPGDPP